MTSRPDIVHVHPLPGRHRTRPGGQPALRRGL
jgi:hypothetical protein